MTGILIAMQLKRFRFLLACAATLGALAVTGCVTTGGQPSTDAASSGSGVTVYGTVDVGVSR